MADNPRHTPTAAEMDARRKASEYLHRWPGAADMECPICHNREWGISDVAVLNVRVDLALATWSGAEHRAYPVVPVTCATCGYMYFLNEKWIRFDGPPPSLRIEHGID